MAEIDKMKSCYDSVWMMLEAERQAIFTTCPKDPRGFSYGNFENDLGKLAADRLRAAYSAYPAACSYPRFGYFGPLKEPELHINFRDAGLNFGNLIENILMTSHLPGLPRILRVTFPTGNDRNIMNYEYFDNLGVFWFDPDFKINPQQISAIKNYLLEEFEKHGLKYKETDFSITDKTIYHSDGQRTPLRYQITFHLPLCNIS